MSYSEEQLDAFAGWERQAWEARAVPYADGIVPVTRGASGALLDAGRVTSGTRLLDVATGPGVVALAARQRGAKVVAVDQASAMVRLARAAGMDCLVASAERLPFGGRAFDAVVAGFLINHLARPEKGVAELARVCRSQVAVSVWDVADANPVLGLFGPVARSLGLVDTAPPGPDSQLFADRARLTAMLERAGLDDVRVTRVEWSVTVDPGWWFDAVAASAPRTSAVLAGATAEQRAVLRERYLDVADRSYGDADGLVTLPAAALVGSGLPVAD